MKRIITIFILFEILSFILPIDVNADNKSEIIDSQKQNLKISDFMKEAENYTKDTMPEIDLNDLLSTAISGKIDNIKLMTLFWKILRKRNNGFGTNIG